MQLSREQVAEIVDKLGKHRKAPPDCPLCGAKAWAISDTVFELREFHGGSIVVGGESKVMPVVSLNCTTCGYTHLVNAISLGIVTKPPAKEEQKK